MSRKLSKRDLERGLVVESIRVPGLMMKLVGKCSVGNKWHCKYHGNPRLRYWSQTHILKYYMKEEATHGEEQVQ